MKKYKGLDCILLVDDDESNNYLHKMVIEKAGIDTFIKEVYNGIEALDFLTSSGKFASQVKYPQPGIIFLDINMPIMNGWEFLEQYNKLPKEQQGKIVMAMLTSSLNPDDEAKAHKINMLKGFIHKPLSASKLLNIVETHFPPEN